MLIASKFQSLILILSLNMRSFFLLFLTTSLLLLSDSHEAAVRVLEQSTIYSLLPSIEKIPQIKTESVRKDFYFIRSRDLILENEELINIEDEEKEVVFTNKHSLIGMYLFLFAFLTKLIYTYLSFRNRPPFCWHLSSCKSTYKTVLRI